MAVTASLLRPPVLSGMTSKYKGYGKDYTTFSYHVSGDHEREAYEAEMAKRPTRFGMFMLRLLGFKGKPPEPQAKDHDLWE